MGSWSGSPDNPPAVAPLPVGPNRNRVADGGGTDLAGLAVAGGLAFLAGATDVYGLGVLHDLFVSFMSGNTTMLGVALGQGDWPRVGSVAGLVGLFVAGAAAGAVLGQVGGRRHAALVVAAVAVALAAPSLRPAWGVAPLVLAMGALNAAISKVGEASVSLTYVTGTLVKLGQGLGRALCGEPAGWTWLWQLPMWASLLAGATLAVVVRARLGPEPWPLSALAALLALATVAHGRE